MKTVDEWKKEELNRLMKGLEHAESIVEILKQKDSENYYQFGEYIKIPMMYKQLIIFNNKDYAEKELSKVIASHFSKLQDKVKEEYGTILELNETSENEYDYDFICEKGNCNVRVINAGGYNIQVKHTRWLLQETKSIQKEINDNELER